MNFETFKNIWNNSKDSPQELINSAHFKFIIYQTKLETDYRICSIELKKGRFKHIKANLFENLIITIENDNTFKMVVSNDDFFEVFNHFTYSIYEKLKNNISNIEVENILIDSFQKYFSLFTKKKKNEINKIVGLFGELLVLKSIIEKKGSSVIPDWNGPDRNRHDFSFKTTSIEVKSSYRDYNSISISNEFQLYVDPPEKLFLYVFQLDVKESSQEDSLKILIKEILELCENADDRLAFIYRLNEAGLTFYENFSIRPQLKIDILDSIIYTVKEEFPRITRNNLVDGIINLKYSILLSSIPDEFKLEEKELWKQLV